MTDKELVLNTLDFLKDKGYQNLPETFWKDADFDTQSRIKNVLLRNKFIRLAEGQPFTFEITTEGNFVKASDLYEDGLLTTLHPLTEIETKILQRINKLKGDPNATDEVLQREFGYDLNDIKDAVNSLNGKKFIYQENDTNQTNLGMRAWKIAPGGEKKVNEIQDKIDIEKNRVDIEKNSRSTNYLAWATFGTAFLGAFGVFFQCYFANEQNSKIERQIQIQEKQLKQQEKESKSILVPQTQNIYITISKDGTVKLDSLKIR